MTYDKKTQSVLLATGRSGQGGEGMSDTWIRVDGDWFDISDGGASPSKRRGAAMAPAVDLEQTVLFGGRRADLYLADTWLTEP